MKVPKLLCWNVNGVRAVKSKGYLDWIYRESPDVISLQETKAHLEQLDADLKEPRGYHAYWNYPERKGYSGVATFTREEPLSVRYDLGAEEINIEGRVIITDYPEFILFNIYFPNGKKDEIRLKYKMEFYEAFLRHADSLKDSGKRLVICGDFNTAHKEIDLARPKENAKLSGFLPEERAWIDRFVDHGYIDTFRHFNQEPGQYTWWDLKSAARERNVGWRIDYFFVSENLLPAVTGAFIMSDIPGSDHCPVGITLEF